jgi:propionate CoA-transferase
LEGYVVRNLRDVERIRKMVECQLSGLPRKVYAIVNYDSFTIFPEVLDAYTTMIRGLVDRFYSGVTRYTTSSFLKVKLGDALQQRAVAPHIYESAKEARTQLDKMS